MKKYVIFVLTFIVISGINAVTISAQQFSVNSSTATLYSDMKHRGEHRPGCVSLLTGASASIWSPNTRDYCDLYYGMLNAGDELDWVQSSSSVDSRSVIRDLGPLHWSATIKVPVVEPLPVLKPGEQRRVSVDVSGADGADGAPGRNGADGDGVVRKRARVEPPPRPKNDGRPKVDPFFVKAVPDHVYVIHVVNDRADFYALFRIEALQRGDHCTISWKRIPDPDSHFAKRQ